MKWLITEGIFGSIITLFGVGLVLVYLEDKSIALLGLGISLLVFGGVFIFRVITKKSLDRLSSNLDLAITTSPKEGMGNKLLENSKTIAEWTKTQEMKDKMKMMQISAAAQIKNQKGPTN